MQNYNLTRKQYEVLLFLLEDPERFEHPPTLEELCLAMGLKSRGSLHKHIQGLIQAGLVEAPNRKQRGIRLTDKAISGNQVEEMPANALPFIGAIAAGKPIEAVEDIGYMLIPEQLKTERPCYILQIKGDSMVDDGIFDGDWVIIEKRSYARNGEIVVALIDHTEATLKHIEQYPNEVVLVPANSRMEPMHYHPGQVEIQGVLVGQMRSYVH